VLLQAQIPLRRLPQNFPVCHREVSGFQAIAACRVGLKNSNDKSATSPFASVKRGNRRQDRGKSATSRRYQRAWTSRVCRGRHGEAIMEFGLTSWRETVWSPGRDDTWSWEHLASHWEPQDHPWCCDTYNQQYTSRHYQMNYKQQFCFVISDLYRLLTALLGRMALPWNRLYMLIVNYWYIWAYFLPFVSDIVFCLPVSWS